MRREADEKSVAAGPSLWAPTASRVLRGIRLCFVHHPRFSRRSIGAGCTLCYYYTLPHQGVGLVFPQFSDLLHSAHTLTPSSVSTHTPLVSSHPAGRIEQILCAGAKGTWGSPLRRSLGETTAEAWASGPN